MQKQIIMDFVKQYLKDNQNPNLSHLDSYYNNCLDKMKTFDQKFDHIPQVAHIFDILKIYFINQTSVLYDFTFSDKKTSEIYVKYTLTYHEYIVLISQLHCLSELKPTLDKFIQQTKKQKQSHMKFEGSQCYFLNISVKNPDGKREINILDQIQQKQYMFNILLGVSSLNVLKLIQIDRLEKIMQNKEIQQYIETVQEHIDIFGYNQLNPNVLYGSFIYLIFGITYHRNLNILSLQGCSKKEALKQLENIPRELNIQILTQQDKLVYESSHSNYYYRYQWITYVWPKLGGADDIFEMTRSSEFTFQFLNFFFLSVTANKERILAGGFPTGVVDLYMMDLITGQNENKDIYIRSAIPRGEDLQIMNTYDFNNTYIKMSEYCKLKFDMDISVQKLKENIPILMIPPDKILLQKHQNDKYTSIISKCIKETRINIYQKYCQKNSNISSSDLVQNILQVGSQRLNDLQLWGQYKIKKVTCFEQLDAYIYISRLRVISHQIEPIVEIVKTTYDSQWENEQKYDLIMINQVMEQIHNLDLFIQNIKRMSRKGTIIYIQYINTQKILQNMISKGASEQPDNLKIIENNTTLFVAQKDDQYIYTYTRGKYIVPWADRLNIMQLQNIIYQFINNGFRIIVNKDLLETDTRFKENLKISQQRILQLYEYMIFQFQ